MFFPPFLYSLLLLLFRWWQQLPWTPLFQQGFVLSEVHGFCFLQVWASKWVMLGWEEAEGWGWGEREFLRSIPFQSLQCAAVGSGHVASCGWVKREGTCVLCAWGTTPESPELQPWLWFPRLRKEQILQCSGNFGGSGEAAVLSSCLFVVSLVPWVRVGNIIPAPAWYILWMNEWMNEFHCRLARGQLSSSQSSLETGMVSLNVLLFTKPLEPLYCSAYVRWRSGNVSNDWNLTVHHATGMGTWRII